MNIISEELLKIIVLTLINSGGIFIIIVLLANSAKSQMYTWLSFLTITIVGWVNFAYLGFADPNPETALFFYKVNLLFVSLFFFAEYMFYVESFLRIRIPALRASLFFISFFFATAALFTDALLINVVPQDWGNEAVFGPLNDLFSLYALLGNVALIILLGARYRVLEGREKMRARFFLLGTFMFILLNIVFNVIVPEAIGSVRYQSFGDYSAVIFLALTVYAMLRHQFLNVRIALASLLIGIIGMLIMFDIVALSRNLEEQLIKGVIFIFFSIISVVLVRSVLNEQNQREQLAVLNNQLHQKAQEQQDMMDVLAHEVKTPMSSMQLEAEYLAKKADQISQVEGDKLANSIKESVDSLQKAAKQGMNIVTGLLEFTRVQNKRFKLSYSEFDVMETVKNSVDAFKKLANNKNYKIKVRSEQESIIVCADAPRIQEAIEGLLTNAQKYGVNPQTGDVNISITLDQDDSNIRISIKDEGMGLTPEDKKRIGEKFYRGENQSQRTKSDLPSPGGTGLGIFMINIIMDAHGGRLTFDSEGENKGSTFTLEFPRSKPDS